MYRVATLILLASMAGSAYAAPAANLWERWTAHNADSQKTIDHSAWTEFLGKYIVHDEALDLNRLRYGAVDTADKQTLDRYIKRLENTAIGQYNRDVQQAFWFNLYNAVTVNLVLDNYPVESIRDIGGGFLSSGPWNDKRTSVNGVELTLNDIEHRILRPIWETPLNHYGVNCASVSCPNLPTAAFTGKNTADMLRANAKAYVNSTRGADIQGGSLTASKIYDWYQVDFGGSEAGVISHMRQFATPEKSAALDALDGVAGYTYDWSLNDAK